MSVNIDMKVEKGKDDIIQYKDFKGEKYVSFQRKAFINYINDDFYKDITKKSKDSSLNIWQIFVKNYLALETPYRGLLVYHGLGTGKTATAVTTAEGLSENMEITTLLPASLETNFVNEVKTWGEELFDLNNNNWVFVEEVEIMKDTKFRKMLEEKYKITPEIITKIYNKAKKKTDDGISKGFWIISEDVEKDKDKIKTISGQILSNDKKVKSGPDKDCIKLSEGEKIQINIQIEICIRLKYNFIHYNPFPSVKSSSIKEFIEKDDKIEYLNAEEEKLQKTNNQKIVKRLEEKLKENQKNHHINSPFYNEVIIIDEVHNFVRSIINGGGPSNIFYEWIINAKNIKLVCLSGTPVINKPSEIAILFNMIRGLTKTYNFSIKTSDATVDTVDIFQKCKDIFYKENSPIDQINVFERGGKIVISIMQNTSRFESIMNPDNSIVYTVQYRNHDFNDFMEYIYNGLHELFDKDDIVPSEKTFNSISEKDKIDIIKGKIVKFNEKGDMMDDDIKKYKNDTNIRFNIFRKLFTIDIENETLDLSDNSSFMDYFFEDKNDILDKKRVLLKRMLLGLASYYPIDRSSIVNMPEIVLPKNNPEIYADYKISKKINVEICQMSSKQFDKYHAAWLADKERNIKFNKKSIYSDENFDYHINTRRICNMIYENDEFRYIKSKGDGAYITEKTKEYNNLFQSGSFKINNGLQKYSPKFNRVLNNIFKFNGEHSKGKILFYSEFRNDSGAEIFEWILQANGYIKFNPEDGETKKYRYTFITGSESPEERKINLDAFNKRENKYGEYLQIMIISGAGAEGISLNCVRQVHILEPYWNYIRVDQVLGRAIRMLSHIGYDKNDPLLPPDKRNVEQYLYLSVFPVGNNIEELYKSLSQLDTWHIPEIEGDIEIVQNLLEHHKDTYDILKKIDDIKKESLDTTADQKLFNIMEKKYNLSSVVTDIIKEASVDCLQNTRDDVNIHQNCVQFDKALIQENSYFPGMTSDKLNILDTKQLKAKFSVYLKPDIYIVSSLMDNNNVYMYYRLHKKDINETDIRYIKENGKLIGILDTDNKYFYIYINDSHELDDKIGSKLSLYQKIFLVDDDKISKINDHEIFPNLSDLKKNVLGYKIKNNITESFYYYPVIDDKPIMRIYDYDNSKESDFDVMNMTSIIVHNKKFYEID